MSGVSKVVAGVGTAGIVGIGLVAALGGGTAVTSQATGEGAAQGQAQEQAQTLTGEAVQFRYGTIQVTVTVQGEMITDVQAETSAADRKSQMINQRALPVLKSEVLEENSAEVDAVFGAMGTVVSVGTDVELSEGVWEAARAVFWGLEQRFSLFRPTSELCVHNSGLVPGMVHSPGFEAMWAAGRWWQDATNGAFCVQRPGGGLDLNGIVKAYAVAEVGRLLDGHGVGCWIVNAGGDVLTSARGRRGGRGGWG